jgi:hypothetical protein
MKKIFFTLLFLAIPLTVTATSWVYLFVVYNDGVYVVSEDETTEVVKEIGHVTAYSDMYTASGNFSNVYPKGTPYYKIDGIDTTEAIAVEAEEGRYVIARYEHEYEHTPSMNSFIEKITHIVPPVDEPINRESGGMMKWVVSATVVVVLALMFIVIRRDRKK